MKYFVRYKIGKDGKITEIKVPRRDVMRQINAMIKRDREMLKILEKL